MRVPDASLDWLDFLTDGVRKDEGSWEGGRLPRIESPDDDVEIIGSARKSK